MNKRKVIGFSFLAFIYAVCTVFGREIEKNDYIKYVEVGLWINIIIYLFVYFTILYVIDLFLQRWKSNSYVSYFLYESKKFLVVCEISMLLVWSIAFLACFPGLAIYDGPAQLTEYHTGMLSSHHPFIHTMFLVLCEWLGGCVVPYTVFNFGFQAVILSMSFIRSIEIVRKGKISPIFLIGTVVWMCAFPIHSLMALATTKDTLFAAFVLLYICELIDLLEYRNVYWESKYRCIRFCLISFSMSIFRNNGIYVLIGGSIVALLLSIKKYKKVILLLLVLGFTYLLYCGPVMEKLQIEKGNMREAMSLIIQPLARVYHEEYDEISVGERKRIEKIFGESENIWYESHKSDAAKSQFDTNFFRDEIKDNVTLWVKLGLKYPDTYLDAVLANTYGNWYPFEKLPDTTTYRMLFEMPEMNRIESKMSSLYKVLYGIGRESTYQKIPVIRLFFSTGMVCWVMLWGLVDLWIERKYREMLIYIPLFFLFITILLGPVALYRYTYPLLICIPVMLSLNRKDGACEKSI